jgi:hypothetical protein
MSEVENDYAKPTLGPLIRSLSARTLSFNTLVNIGIFLFLKSVVGDHMTKGGDPFFSLSERYTFENSLSIPFGPVMFIGALEDTFKGTFRTAHVVPKSATENDFGLYVFTFAVGHLVLQLVGAKWATLNAKRNLAFPAISQKPEDAVYMTPYWPPVETVQWPPSQHLPVGLLNQVTDRWRTYNII